MKYLIFILFFFSADIAFAQPTYKTTLNVAGSGGGGGGGDEIQVKYLSINDTSTNTTLSTVNDLTFNLESNTSYHFEYLFIYHNLPAGGMKSTIGGTVGFDLHRAVGGFGSSTLQYVQGITFDAYLGAISGATMTNAYHTICGIIQTNSTGTIEGRFAQWDGDGGNTILLRGSFGILTKIN